MFYAIFIEILQDFQRVLQGGVAGVSNSLYGDFCFLFFFFFVLSLLIFLLAKKN